MYVSYYSTGYWPTETHFSLRSCIPTRNTYLLYILPQKWFTMYDMQTLEVQNALKTEETRGKLDC